MNIYEFMALIVLSVMWFMVVASLSTMIVGKTPTDKQVLIVGIFAGPVAWAIFGGCYAYEYYKHYKHYKK
jgi:hypothetical protein